MKRFGLTLVAAVCLTASAFAAGNQPTTAKWEGNINVYKLGQYLQMSDNQHEEVADICKFFDKQMKIVTNEKNNQPNLIKSAIYSNLKLMKNVLNEEQLIKYANLLNVTLQNKGLEVK